MLSEKTNVLPKRQKLIGLTTLTKVKVTDQVLLSELKPKSKAMTTIKTSSDGIATKLVQHNFILMGTPEANIFVDPTDLIMMAYQK